MLWVHALMCVEVHAELCVGTRFVRLGKRFAVWALVIFVWVLALLCVDTRRAVSACTPSCVLLFYI